MPFPSRVADSGVVPDAAAGAMPTVVRLPGGLADTKSGELADAGHRFRIAGNTMSFVSTVVLPLEGEGRLSLVDSVERWLPGMVAGNGNSDMSVRQLLTHTTGVHDPTMNDER